MSTDQDIAELKKRISELEHLTMQLKPLGPNPEQAEKLERERGELIKQALLKLKPPPVDRTSRVLVSGDPVPEDYSHTELKNNGQQKDYVVLTADERGKGFVRPYRDAYRHTKCRAITAMSRAIAETYARDPHFYTGTFCSTCRAHFPIGENGEFLWYEMDGTTGPKVGT